MTIKIGIIGYGNQGKYHKDVLWNSPDFKITSILEKTNIIEPIDVDFYSSYDKFINENTFDFLVIATPSDTHFQIAKKILNDNVNVIIEKPTSLSYEEVSYLIKLANSKSLIIISIFNRRYDCDFTYIKALVLSKQFGKINQIESRICDNYHLTKNYPDRKDWKLKSKGGGILYDWGPHLFDQAFELFSDQDPKALYCIRSRPNNIVNQELEEQFTILLHYHNFTFFLNASWNSAIAPFRWYITGSEGAIRVNSREFEVQKKFIIKEKIFEENIKLTESDLFVFEIRKLVKDALKNKFSSRKELERMLKVAYGIDLAFSSSKLDKPMKWEFKKLE